MWLIPIDPLQWVWLWRHVGLGGHVGVQSACILLRCDAIVGCGNRVKQTKKRFSGFPVLYSTPRRPDLWSEQKKTGTVDSKDQESRPQTWAVSQYKNLLRSLSGCVSFSTMWRNNPDWAPSLKLGYETSSLGKRYKRAADRMVKKKQLLWILQVISE